MPERLRIYGNAIDPKALAQFHDAMEQDFVVQGALMPDAHVGYSLPIGGVVATDGVVVPAWVGYDIGCGMCALPTTFAADAVGGQAESIFAELYQRIPTGFSMHTRPVETQLDRAQLAPLGRKAFDARGQFQALGTLGGGNHFIEIGADERGQVWIIIHSGSRGIGHGVATEYMRLASGDGKVREGHYGLSVNSDGGQAYINDMDWCLAYALENRTRMMQVAVATVADHCQGVASWDALINRNHNHAEDSHGMWVHRKGATHAEAGMMGVIPGNMRDGSCVVRGLGNPQSLWSSSHGAGRVLGRRQAHKQLKLRDFRLAMEGITARVTKGTLDESPMAYKDIHQVMEWQADLVEVVHHVRPILNMKA